jgi:hypothetical protein
MSLGRTSFSARIFGGARSAFVRDMVLCQHDDVDRD